MYLLRSHQPFLKLLFISCLIAAISPLFAQPFTIPISTQSHTLVLQADSSRLLKTVYFGESLKSEAEYSAIYEQYDFTDNNIGICNAVYTTAGTWNLSEPAIQIAHSDGNTSLELKYVSHQQEALEENVQLTRIVLEDPVYPVQVILFYKVFVEENVIEQWTEIKNQQNKNITLQKFSSANLYFTNEDFYLTTFHNQWAKEMQANESKLGRGVKVVDSKMGARTMLLQSPSFILSFDGPAEEHSGQVLLGQLAWSGNFKLEFEIDSYDNLRFIGGINPYGSAYSLAPQEVFKTPSLIYTVSSNGLGEASRNLHQWARTYRVLDGKGNRLTLLNNWEATYFDFDEKKIANLFKGARELGVDLFLLDDGWFGNKYPRNSDRSGLGDWQENVAKLPNGIGYLVKEAQREQVKFGIWIEPEMVSPKSELYENHLDWVIRQEQRPEVYFRNQLVLDLSNPEVQDFIFEVVDRLFTENPELAFIKWDCNAVIYNAYSAYLDQNNLPQSHLYVEHVRGLYSVLERIRKKYPKVPMMLCSGGGGRGDYELLKYFTEFWPSDNTDPLERIFMQWNYSYFFPSVATDNHVTNWGQQPIKYKVDVASMGKLGFDIRVDELDEKELLFCQEAVKNYQGFKEVIWKGDLYRLRNPHHHDVASLMYVSPDKSRSIVFNYLVSNRVLFHTNTEPIRLEGLAANQQYRIREINLYPGTHSSINTARIYSGDFLMKIGINPDINNRRKSVVLEINAVKK
ncbi:MAG: alpha-galactosidase [Bacteroidota bacterium]